MNELQIFLVETIKTQVATSPLNRLKNIDGSPIWEEPLIGFADGDDPVFELFKSVVTPEHWMPRDALAAKVSEVGGREGMKFQQEASFPGSCPPPWRQSAATAR